MTTAFRDLVILIPHQRAPMLVDPQRCEPPVYDDHDSHVAGDHDMHASQTVGDWLDHEHIRGHQRIAVNAMLRREADVRGETISL